MKHQGLFFLHPFGYAHAQEILRQESEMVRNGQSKDQRIDFLELELERITSSAEILLIEHLAPLLPSSQNDLASDLDALKQHFVRHGFSGTLRQMRNTMRRHGFFLPVLDPVLLVGGLGLLSDEPDITEAIQTLLAQRIQTLLQHPDVEAADRKFMESLSQVELPSVREKRMIAEAQAALLPILDEMDGLWDFDDAEIRLFAKIYGRVLDLSLADILVHLVENGAASVVWTYLRDSVKEGIPIYQYVLHEIVNDRLQKLGKGGIESVSSVRVAPIQSQAVSDPENNNLLTVSQAIKLLNVSRQTLHRLVVDKKINTVKIGRSVRFDKADLERFIGR